eukprot:GHVS01049312.1.p1 GENE.GHVS01049312.1~~GHVS01049312.1.p1  ORF type:complete len:650 (-),score=79.06 GHVS01049312.1:290-2239(-)
MMVGESSSLSRLGFCWRLTLCCLLMLVVLVKGNNVDVSDSLENAEPVDMTHQQFVKQKPSPPYYVRITELLKGVQQKEVPKEGDETPATVVTSVEDSKGVALFFFHGLQSELPKWQGQIELYLNNLVSNVPVYLWVPDYHQTIPSGFIAAGEEVAPSFVKGIEHLQDLQPKIDCLFFCHSVGCLTLFHLLLPRSESAIGNGGNAGGDKKTKQTTWPVDQLCSKPDSLALREVSMKGCPFSGFKTDSPFLKWNIRAGISDQITPYGGIIDDLRLSVASSNSKLLRLWVRLKNSLTKDCSIFSETKGLLKGGLHLFGAAHDEVFGQNSTLAAPWGVTEDDVTDSGLKNCRSITKVKAKVKANEKRSDKKESAVIKAIATQISVSFTGNRVHRYSVDFYKNMFVDLSVDEIFGAGNHFPSVPMDSALTPSFLSQWMERVYRACKDSNGETGVLTSEETMKLAVQAAKYVATPPESRVRERLDDEHIKVILVDMFIVMRRSVEENSKMFPHNFLISNGIGTDLTGRTVQKNSASSLTDDQLWKLMRDERDEVYEQMCKLELAALYRPGQAGSQIIAAVVELPTTSEGSFELKNQGVMFSEYVYAAANAPSKTTSEILQNVAERAVAVAMVPKSGGQAEAVEQMVAAAKQALRD